MPVQVGDRHASLLVSKATRHKIPPVAASGVQAAMPRLACSGSRITRRTKGGPHAIDQVVRASPSLAPGASSRKSSEASPPSDVRCHGTTTLCRSP
jgi:hypothetical protein